MTKHKAFMVTDGVNPARVIFFELNSTELQDRIRNHFPSVRSDLTPADGDGVSEFEFDDESWRWIKRIGTRVPAGSAAANIDHWHWYDEIQPFIIKETNQ